jgi:hypothetical protein
MYEKCVIAGPLQCALYEKTPATIKARVDKIFNSLLTHPISTVIGTGSQDYGLVDYGVVQNLIFRLLYAPFNLGGPAMFALLAGLEKGNGSLLYREAQTNGFSSQCSCDETVSQSTGGFNLLAGLVIEMRTQSTIQFLTSKHGTKPTRRIRCSQACGHGGCSAR